MPTRVKEPYAVEPRKLPSGRWKGRVVRYDSETGKRHELTRAFDTKKEAKNWAEKEAAQYRDDPNRKPPSEETLEEFLKHWLDIKGTLNLTEKTLTSYRQMAAHSIRELGATALRSIAPLQIQQFYVKLAQSANLSPRTIRYVHTVLKMALDDAVEWGLISGNPARKVKVASGARTKELRIPTPEEMATLLEANRDTRWYPLWLWFTTTGSRLGEALALRWGDIDWERRTVTIQRAISGDAGKRVVKTPKTVSGHRTLRMGPELIAVLQNQRSHQDDLKGLAGDSWENENLIFTTLQGKMLSKRYVARAFKAALFRAGLPNTIRVHDLRHGVATYWLSAGKNPVVVSKRLGHSNVAFTMQVYGHVLPNDEAQMAEEMEAGLLSSTEGSGHTGRRRAAEAPKNPTTEDDAV